MQRGRGIFGQFATRSCQDSAMLKGVNAFLLEHDLLSIERSPELKLALVERLQAAAGLAARAEARAVLREGSGTAGGSSAPAELQFCLGLMRSKALLSGTEGSVLLAPLLRVLTVLARAPPNRQQLGGDALLTVVTHLYSKSASVRHGAVSLLVNLCYDQKKVDAVVELGGVKPLVTILTRDKESLATRDAAASALVSIAYRPNGRMTLLELKALPTAVALLSSDVGKLRAKGAGIVRNLSVDLRVTAMAREAGAIAPLVSLVSRLTTQGAANAAGAVQNLAREDASREALAKTPIVGYLVRMILVCPRVKGQVSACAALCNMLAPRITAKGFCGFRRKLLLKSVLSDALAMGIAAPVVCGEQQWAQCVDEGHAAALRELGIEADGTVADVKETEPGTETAGEGGKALPPVSDEQPPPGQGSPPPPPRRPPDSDNENSSLV